jgi:hypothetical protein
VKSNVDYIDAKSSDNYSGDTIGSVSTIEFQPIDGLLSGLTTASLTRHRPQADHHRSILDEQFLDLIDPRSRWKII